MTQDEKKRAAAQKAMELVEDDAIIGVGTGSTVDYFIQELAAKKYSIQGAVSSSERSTAQLRTLGIEVFDLNSVSQFDLYVDGADEVNEHKQLIKGGGAALTREKIVAAVAREFICITDDSKQVTVLGTFPLPVEVIPMARSYVAREIVKLGGDPEYREGVVTDNGNHIIDVHNLHIINPLELEHQLNNVVGVVTNGLFAHRRADKVVMASEHGVVVW